MRCPFCEKRKEIINTLKRRHKNKYDYINACAEEEKKLVECCNKILGSISDYYIPDKKNACHHHVCSICGKRYPEKGSYKEDWIDINGG